jgi:hypothetical protein
MKSIKIVLDQHCENNARARYEAMKKLIRMAEFGDNGELTVYPKTDLDLLVLNKALENHQQLSTKVKVITKHSEHTLSEYIEKSIKRYINDQ